MGAPGTGTGYILSKNISTNSIDRVAAVSTPEGNAALLIANLVYNPNTLNFELMQQPIVEVAGDLTVTMGDVEKILAGNYWKQERYDYDVNGNAIYIGRHLSATEVEGDTAWWIWKLTWTDGAMTRKQGPITGTWTGRAGLGW